MRSFQKILVIAIISVFIISGCSKDNDTPDPLVPPTNKELLTAKTWQVGETYQNITGTRFHYLRGGENTSGVNMGALRIKFNPDGTGSHTDVDGNSYTLSWAFSSTDERSIHIVIEGNIIIDWYFVDIEADVVLQSANVSTNGLVTAKWIPVP